MGNPWFITTIEELAKCIKQSIAEGWDPKAAAGGLDGVPCELLYQAFKAEQCGMQGFTPDEARLCVQRGLELIAELGVEVSDEDRVAILVHNMAVMITNSEAASIVAIGEALGCDLNIWQQAFDGLWKWYEDDSNLVQHWYYFNNKTAADAATALIEDSNRVRILLGLPPIERSDPRFVRLSKMMVNSGWWY